MVDLKNIDNIFFIGIGGIGMSALARYFHHQGKRVRGYDRTETELTKALKLEGIEILFDDNADLLPETIGLVIFTPAIPTNNNILAYCEKKGYPLMKRSEVLGQITADARNVCVAGTHGKTTISTMIAHILRDSGMGSNAFLGGISTNYNTNFWSSPENICVVEADEYDRSFLRLHPDVAVISSMDPDHLDIYGTGEAVQEAFVAFSAKIKSGGTMVNKLGLPLPKPVNGIRQISYHLTDSSADVYTENLRIRSGNYVFDVQSSEGNLQDVRLNIGGRHNVENALAAITACRRMGLPGEKIIPALHNFGGVKRRFEYHVPSGPVVYIDDYAHHPKELEALIGSARELFPDRQMVVVFQPHLFSRTKDFAAGFARALDEADLVFLLPVYPARELPVEGVTSAIISEKMMHAQVQMKSRQEVLDWAGALRPEEKVLLVTAGAGDIDTLIRPLEEILKAK